jgi:hypothetical protein
VTTAGLPGRSLDSQQQYLGVPFGGNIEIAVLRCAATASDGTAWFGVGAQAKRESRRSGDRQD